MTKLEQRAIDLLRKCDRKGESFPAVWAFVERKTGGRFKSLSQLMESAPQDAHDEIFTRLIVAEIVNALETGNLELLEEQKPQTKA